MARSKHILPFLLEGAVQELDSASANTSWNQLTSFVNIASTGAMDFTVGEPLQKVPGALLSIVKENIATGAISVKTSTLALDDEFDTIILTEVDHSCLLMWNGEKWVPLTIATGVGTSTFNGGTVTNATTFSNAVDVTTGGVTIDDGGLTVTLGGASVTGGITIPTGNLAVSSGNATVGGTLTQTGAATFTTGYQASSVDVTATSDGTGTGVIDAGVSYVTVTSSDANYIATLPSPVAGNIIHIFVGANGFELRSSDPATISINGGAGANFESAIAANTLVRCVCTSATTWVATQFAADGTETAVEVAAA